MCQRLGRWGLQCPAWSPGTTAPATAASSPPSPRACRSSACQSGSQSPPLIPPWPLTLPCDLRCWGPWALGPSFCWAASQCWATFCRSGCAGTGSWCSLIPTRMWVVLRSPPWLCGCSRGCRSGAPHSPPPMSSSTWTILPPSPAPWPTGAACLPRCLPGRAGGRAGPRPGCWNRKSSAWAAGTRPDTAPLLQVTWNPAKIEGPSPSSARTGSFGAPAPA